jgi:hypothetical protein
MRRRRGFSITLESGARPDECQPRKGPRERSGLRVDILKTSSRALKRLAPLIAPLGRWKIDNLAAAIPEWRGDPSAHERVIAARLAVCQAFDSGRGVATRSRAYRERALVARHGFPRRNRFAIRDPLAELPILAQRARGDPVAYASLLAAERLAIFFGVDTTPIERAFAGFTDQSALAALERAIRRAAEGREGDRVQTGIREFIQHLAIWWWQITGKTPAKRAVKAYGRTGGATFPGLAAAALEDVGAGGEHSRTIRSALDQLEDRGVAPWIQKS